MNLTTNFTGGYYDKVKFDLTTGVVLYTPVLIVCLIGNILVCVTIMSNREMRSKRWYYFLMNLAIADMGYALVTPFYILQIYLINIGKYMYRLLRIFLN